MTCEMVREQLVETARGRELSTDLRAIVFEHTAQCSRCAERLEAQQLLSAAFSNIALRAAVPCARVEEALLRKLPTPIGKKSAMGWWWTGGAAAAAALAIGFIWNQHVAPTTVARGQESSSDFVALPFAEETSVGEQTDVIRVSMPGESLLAMGIPVSSDLLGEQVQADVEIGMDGTARAIRLAN